MIIVRNRPGAPHNAADPDLPEETVPAVRRPDPLALELDLSRRLAEEFATVPIPMVTSAVKSAVAAAHLFGDDIASSLGTIEQLAREDLLAIQAATSAQDDIAAEDEIALAG
ncbi:MAG: hypothetical protein QOJ03_1004 [Frankiaceae bacterium]|nr:hypothetical protein [Frankiaceae bacterium]